MEVAGATDIRASGAGARARARADWIRMGLVAVGRGRDARVQVSHAAPSQKRGRVRSEVCVGSTLHAACAWLSADASAQ
jgi:hypothetical protein